MVHIYTFIPLQGLIPAKIVYTKNCLHMKFRKAKGQPFLNVRTDLEQSKIINCHFVLQTSIFL